MSDGTTTTRPAGWHPALVLLHWLTVIAVTAQYVLAQQMTDETGDLIARLGLYQWHKSIGLTVAALVALRLAIRTVRPAPPPPSESPTWQKWAARLVHAGLYLCLIALPLTGFLMVSAAPIQIPTLLFGAIDVPHPIGPDKAIYESMLRAHDLAGDALLALAAIHVAGASFHQLAWGDNVLRRMWFGARPPQP